PARSVDQRKRQVRLRRPPDGGPDAHPGATPSAAGRPWSPRRPRHAGLRGGSRSEQFQGEEVLAGGDVVVAIDGRPVGTAAALVRIVTNELRPGQTALFAVLR